MDRARIIDQNFIAAVDTLQFPLAHSTTTPALAGLSREDFLDIFDAQIASRHLDIQARILREQNQGFYTIGSSGHEGNAAIAQALLLEDMGFLHYRSGALMIQRAKRAGVNEPYI